MTRTLDFFRSVPSRLQQRGLQGLAADQGEIDAEDQRRKEEEERTRQLEQIRKQYDDATAQTTQAATQTTQQDTFRDDLLSQAKSRFEELTGHIGQGLADAGEARDQAMQTPTRDVADTIGETVGGAASGAGAAVSGAIGQYGDWRDDLQARGPKTSVLEGPQAQAIGGAVRSAAQAAVPGFADLEAQGQAQRTADVEAGKTNVPAEPVSGAEAALMGARRREGWDETQNADRDRQRRYREASDRQDTTAMAAIQAEERQATQAEGGLLPAAAKRLGRAVGQGVLGALGSDPNAPGSTYAPKEERPVYDAQGHYTGRAEDTVTQEAPQGLARIRRDVPEQFATLTGQGKRNENPLERAQAGFGLAMTPFNVTGELAAGAAGEISDDEVIAAEARLAGDVLGPGGPVREFGAAARTGVDALKAARAGGTLEDVLKASGGLREAGKAAMTGSAIAISPGAGMQAYREGRARGLSHEEALAQAIEMAGNVAQAGEIGDLGVGLATGAVKGVRGLPNAPRALLGATGNITPDMSLGEGLRGAAGTAARELGAYGRGVTEDLTGALAREGQRPATAMGARAGREQLPGDVTPDSPEVARLRQQVGEINRERAQAAQALGTAGIKLGPPDRPPRGLTPEQQPTWDAYVNASRQATGLQNEITRLKQGGARAAETARSAALAEPTGVAPPGLPRQGRGSYEEPPFQATRSLPNRVGPDSPPTMTDVTQTKQGEVPAFYSALQQAVTQLPEGRLSPAQLGKQLLALPEVKRDQIVWSGLDDYLTEKLQANGGRGEAVTKGELSTWLQDHDVRVYEIAKGNSADPALRRQVVETHAQAQERYQDVQDTYRDSHAQRIEDARQILTTAQDRVRAEQGQGHITGLEDTYVHADALIGGYPNVPPGESVFEAIAQDSRGGPGSLSPLLQALTPEERAQIDALRRADADEGDAVMNAYRAETDARMAMMNTQERTNLPGGPAEWAKAGYVMPEGWAPEANAREFLLTLGPRSDMPDWQKPAHWQEPNVIAHLRVSDRMTPDGRRVLFVEELQSDWHQDARDVVKDQSGQDVLDPQTGRAQRVGYYEGQPTPVDPAEAERLEALRQQLIDLEQRPTTPDTHSRLEELRSEAQSLEREIAARQQQHDTGGRPPAGPFKGEGWQRLALKRLLHLAATEDYDALGLTPGDVHAQRYNPFRQGISALTYDLETQALRIETEARRPGGQSGDRAEYVKPEDLHRYVGREVAQHLLDPEAQAASKEARAAYDAGAVGQAHQRMQRLRGAGAPPREVGPPIGVRIGQEDMAGLTVENEAGAGLRRAYDEILPAMLNDLARRFGARVQVAPETDPVRAMATGQTEAGVLLDPSKPPDALITDQPEVGQARQRPNFQPAHLMDVTPEMKAALTTGNDGTTPGAFPLFIRPPQQARGDEPEEWRQGELPLRSGQEPGAVAQAGAGVGPISRRVAEEAAAPGPVSRTGTTPQPTLETTPGAGDAPFYSALSRAIESPKLPETMKPAWLAGQLKGLGVTTDELRWTGLDDYLAQKITSGERVTKQEIRDYLVDNKVEVVEVALGADPAKLQDWAAAAQDLKTLRKQMGQSAPGPDRVALQDALRAGEARVQQAEQAVFVEPREGRRDVAPDAPRWPDYSSAGTSYHGGAAGYREFVLLLPQDSRAGRQMANAGGEPYTHGHWGDLPNPLLHVRTTVRTLPDGRRVLYVEEVQSDLHQAARNPIRNEATGEKLLDPVTGKPQQVGYRATRTPFTPDDPRLAARRPLHEAAAEARAEYRRIDDLKQNSDPADPEYREILDARDAALDRMRETEAALTGRQPDGSKIEPTLDELEADVAIQRERSDAATARAQQLLDEQTANRPEGQSAISAAVGQARDPAWALERERGTDPASQLRAARNEASLERRALDALEQKVAAHPEGKGPPEAPFGETSQWASLALKRMLRVAADEGLDGVAITSGENAARRVNAAQQVQEITWEPYSGQTKIVDTNGETHRLRFTEARLREHVGDEMAQRLIDKAEADNDRYEQEMTQAETEQMDAARDSYRDEFFQENPDATEEDFEDAIERGALDDYQADFEHLDPVQGSLSQEEIGEASMVGNTKMMGWYDQDVVNIAAKLGKKFGATVERNVALETPGSELGTVPTNLPGQEDTHGVSPTEPVTVIGLPESARTQIREQGLPLFLQRQQAQQDGAAAGAPGRGLERVAEVGGAVAGGVRGWQSAEEESDRRVAEGKAGLTGVEKAASALGLAAGGATAGRLGVRGARLAKVAGQPGAARGSALLDFLRGGPGADLLGVGKAPQAGRGGRSGVTAFGQEEAGGQPMAPTPGERFRDRQGIAQPYLGLEPHTPEGQVVDALDARAEQSGVPLDDVLAGKPGAIEAYYPSIEELAKLPGAPPAKNKFGTARPIKDLLTFMEAGLNRGAHRWYNELSDLLREYSTPLQQALGDPSERPDLWQELVGLYGRTGQRTTPEANLEISLAAILARDDLRRKGIDVTTLDPESEHDQGVLRHAMRPYTQIVTGETRGQIEPTAIQAEVDRRKAALTTLYPDGTVPPVTTLKEMDKADGGDRVKRDEAAKVGGVPTTGLVLGDILAMWKTGQADIDGNLKLATYFSVIKDQATGQVSLGSVPDIWMFKAFGHENIEAMSSNSEASRYILGTIARLAGERGITPDQAQAAIWVGVRALFDTDPRWSGEHALREDASQRPGALKGATEDAAKAEAKVISRLPLAETLGAKATEAREALEAAKARGVPVPGAPSKQQRANPEMAEAVGFYDQEMTARRAARKAQTDADNAEASASMALGERERIAGGGPIQHKPPTAIAGIRTRLEANGYGDEVGDLTDPATLSRFMATTGTPDSMQKVNEGLIDLFRRRVAQPDGISPAPLGGELSVAHSTKPPALPYTQSEATSARGRQRALEQGRTVRFAPPFHPGADRLSAAGVTPPAGWGTTPAKARADTVAYLKAVWGYDERTSTLRALTPYARHRVTLDLLGTWANDAGTPIEEYNVGIHLPLATQTQAEQVASVVGAVTLQDAMGIARPKADVPAPGTPERRTAQKTPNSGVDNQVVLTHPEGKAWTRPEIVKVFGGVVPGMEITPGGKLVINNYEGAPAMAFAWDVRKRLRAAKPNLNVTKLVSYTSVDFTYIPSNEYGQHIRAGGDTALRAPGSQAGSEGPAGAVGQLGADQAGGHDRGGDRRNGPVDGRGPNTRGPATLGPGFFDDLRGKTRRHLEQQGWTFPEGWTERDTAALFPAPTAGDTGGTPSASGIVAGRGAASGQPAFTALEQAPEDVRGLARRLQQTYQQTAGGFGLPVDRLDAAAGAAGAVAGGVAEAQLEAPQDETPQERLKRIAGGAATGGVAGVTARRSGASILRNLPAFHADEVGAAGQLGRSGITARAAQQALEQAVSNGASEAEIARMAREVVAAKAAAAAPPPPAPGPPGAARKAWGAVKDVNTGANSLIRASALSSPLTLGRNVVQGAAGAVEQPLERFIASGLDDLIGKVRQDRGTRAGEQVSVQEAGAMAKASLTGLGKAFTAGVDAFWGRSAQGDLGATQGVSRMETRLGKAVEKKTDALFAPTKFINGFFNALSEHVETAGLTTREARATGQDVNALRANPSLTTQARATRAAEYRSLQDQMDGLGKALSVVGEVPIVGPALMPFYKTPYNAVKYGLERMPGTSLLYTAKKWADPTASNVEVAEQAARAVYGLALWTGFFALATASDRLTGAEPSNQTEREEWQAEGKQPYSVRIGDRWFSFSLFPAIHNALVTAAETGDLVRQATHPEERDSEDVAGAVFTKLLMIGKEAAQRPVFGGLTDLLDAMDEPEKNGPRLGESIVGNFSSGFTAPAIGRWAANAADPYERTAKGLGERVQSAHPWERQELPIARTHMGDERDRVQGLEGVVGRALFPLKTSRARPERQFYEYGDAQSAKQDRMIRQAKDTVDRYNRAKDEYPVPTEAELALAAMAKSRDPNFDKYRAAEAKGRRQEQTARGGGGTPQGTPQRRVTGPAALLLGRR